MYCTKCGALVSDGSKFCAKCGSLVSGESSDRYPSNGISMKQSGKRRKRILAGIGVLSVLMVLAIVLFATGVVRSRKKEEIYIVVDAAHGGDDPGKIGINNTKEKEINLKIAKELEKLLKKEDIKVVMTRTDDGGLYQQSSNNKKVEDMRKRYEIITEANPVFTVSIHQNSYPNEKVKGAQTYYYGQSEEGKKLAEILQKYLVAQLAPQNHRNAKANESYYLLKETLTPTVIVECGFLSNLEEEALLSTEGYQEKVAQAVKAGILEYLSQMDKNTVE